MASKLTTVHDHREREEFEEENAPPNIFPFYVFDAGYCGEPVPSDFNAIRIPLDGGVKADLSWKKEQEAAASYKAKGLRIFWDMDLGLAEPMVHSLGHATQYLALTLSLEHFCKTLWKEFSEETLGLCLYRGLLDFSQTFFWDETQVLNLQDWVKHLFKDIGAFNDDIPLAIGNFSELSPALLMENEAGKDLLRLFCRDAMGEYLHLLASRVPDQLPLFLMFDGSEIKNVFSAAQLLNQARYPRFHLAVKTAFPEMLEDSISWDGTPLEKGSISHTLQERVSKNRAKIGICMPELFVCRPSSTKALRQAFVQLQQEKKHFRVIPEENLAMEWEELDYLIVDPQMVSLPLKRKLQGFCAAGGIVVSLGKPIGLAEEIPLRKFLVQ